ncbi:MAG: alpha/beta fold hydrolase [Alphaproteobacteria bacterium]
MKVALSTGISMFYEKYGSGPPLVLIPGTSLDHEFWALQVAAFAERFTTIVLDPRGAGQTDAPREEHNYSTTIMADDVAALMATLGVESAHVAGLSLGSAIAQQLVVRHPARVRSVQLHGTWGKSDAWFRQFFTDPMTHLLKSGDLHMLFKFGQSLTMSPEYLETRGPPAVADIVSRCVVRSAHPATAWGFAGQLHADATHDAWEGLRGIRVPTLVTVGELDTNTPMRYSRAVHQRIPNSRFHLLTGARSSHCNLWEMPDEFNRVVLDFLQSL